MGTLVARWLTYFSSDHKHITIDVSSHTRYPPQMLRFPDTNLRLGVGFNDLHVLRFSETYLKLGVSFNDPHLLRFLDTYLTVCGFQRWARYSLHSLPHSTSLVVTIIEIELDQEVSMLRRKWINIILCNNKPY